MNDARDAKILDNLARKAYEAHWSEPPTRDEGPPVAPPWAEVPEPTKARWRASADAVRRNDFDMAAWRDSFL